MKIHYLWHSEFICELKNKEWNIVRIMSDAWLSNYVFWDMMERNPKVKIDFNNFNVDAIFISHSHCDHLDPYTLIEIYNNIKPRPLLLIPETIAFLVPLFAKYLPKQKIEILKNKKVFNLNWIDIEWIIFENDYLTNEDDVMTLAISNDKELLYTDVDTVPPENEETIEYLYDLFTKKDYENAIYLSTRNELEGNFKILEAKNIDERLKIASDYTEQRKEEIEYNYCRFDEDFIECSDIQDLPYFSKALIGQWIVFPTSINPDFLKIHILDLEEEAKIEKNISKKYRKNFEIVWFKPWKVYEVKWKTILEAWVTPFLSEVIYSNPKSDIKLELFKTDKEWPLENRKWNFKAQEWKILQILNNRFLPYRLANTQDNLKNAMLNSKNHRYVVKVRYGNLDEYFERNYYFDFSSTEFQEERWEHVSYNEDYWANDLEDFLDGRQELYSNFWHKLRKDKTYRVWTCLWANFLNNDLIYKKFELHFKRASIWESVDSFVERYIK